jgi:hypothetical protein
LESQSNTYGRATSGGAVGIQTRRASSCESMWDKQHAMVDRLNSWWTTSGRRRSCWDDEVRNLFVTVCLRHLEGTSRPSEVITSSSPQLAIPPTY